MEQSKKGLLPIRHGLHLSKNMCPKTPEEIQQMSKIPYASGIGSLMYAMVCTRPDIGSCLDERFITELNVVQTIMSPVPLSCDKNGAIAQAKEPRSHQRSKHFDNVANPLTKPMSQSRLDRHTEKMGIRYMAKWL
ncbi:unnamed protein product [Prunus brigantina]